LETNLDPHDVNPAPKYLWRCFILLFAIIFTL